MGNFVNPFTDVGFKRIFGQEFSKPLLLDFLNNLLKGELVVTDITFLDKELPAVYRDDRSLIYDILCKTDDGRRIIVEMQNKSQPFFTDRCIYYLSQSVARQGERGEEWNYEINAVYLVAFMNFKIDKLKGRFRSDVALLDMKTHEQFSDKERFIFLQLPLFNKDVDECENGFERWIYILKNMDILDRLPWTAKNSVFDRLAKIASVSQMNEQERLEYDDALRRYRDTMSVMEGAMDEGRKEGLEEGKQKGLEEGIQKGLEEGIHKGIMAVARNMKLSGMNVDVISKMTGLSKDKILSL